MVPTRFGMIFERIDLRPRWTVFTALSALHGADDHPCRPGAVGSTGRRNLRTLPSPGPPGEVLPRLSDPSR